MIEGSRFSHIPLHERSMPCVKSSLLLGKNVSTRTRMQDSTSWNGLMIAALARGAWVLGDEKYAQAAEKAVRFILDHLRSKEGRLLARYRDGEAAFPAYLDDYAFLSWGLIELYRATFNPYYLEEAITQAKEMQRLFGMRKMVGSFSQLKMRMSLICEPRKSTIWPFLPGTPWLPGISCSWPD